MDCFQAIRFLLEVTSCAWVFERSGTSGPAKHDSQWSFAIDRHADSVRILTLIATEHLIYYSVCLLGQWIETQSSVRADLSQYVPRDVMRGVCLTSCLVEDRRLSRTVANTGYTRDTNAEVEHTGRSVAGRVPCHDCRIQRAPLATAEESTVLA